MNYSKSYCRYDCNTCSKVCPTGAIEKISLEQKQHLRIGMAKIDREKCIGCGVCVFKCPTKALSLDENRVLQFDGAKCIGCGACQVSCPQNAIEIVGIVEQSKTTI